MSTELQCRPPVALGSRKSGGRRGNHKVDTHGAELLWTGGFPVALCLVMFCKGTQLPYSQALAPSGGGGGGGGGGFYSYSSDTVEGPRRPAVKLTARHLAAFQSS